MLWYDIKGSSRAIAYANHFSNKGGLIITNSEQDAKVLFQEMTFFEPALKGRLLHLPDSETLPFDLQAAPAIIMSQRAAIFHQLCSQDSTNNVLIVSASNAMRVISGPSFWTGQVRQLTPGAQVEEILGGKTADVMKLMGYEQTARVKSPGQWARRGLVFDIYPVGLAYHAGQADHMAVRIRVNERDQITSINKMDPLTQESSPLTIDLLNLFPNREYAITKEFCTSFRRTAFSVHEEARRFESYRSATDGQDHPELASWIGLPGTDHTSVLNIAPGAEVVFDEQAEDALHRQWMLVNARHLDIKDDTSRLCPPVHLSWLSPDQVVEALQPKTHYKLDRTGTESGMKRPGTLSAAIDLIKSILSDNLPTLFVMKSDVRMRNIRTICRMSAYPPTAIDDFKVFAAAPQGVAYTQGNLVEGFTDLVAGYRVITEPEVFGVSIESSVEDDLGEHQRKVILQGLGDIELGDPMVHALYGVGRFQGFETVNLGTAEEDMLKIGYHNSLSTFVRVSDLDLVSRYSGAEPEKAPLTKMNDESWLKGLKIAQESAFEAARELITLRNLRRRSTGVVLNPPDERYVSFCETFPYEETPDQKRTIVEIEHDLTSGLPMDRLVCGDVGFGKTEVANRAAFLMSSQSYQVAFLAPTTLLAQQHYQSLLKRFEDTPIRIALAERGTLNAKMLAAIKNGDVEIIIGTHRILQEDVVFKNLGLIIIDEEHRFGVRQKDHLRTLRGNKHVLSLAATPIPRTLGMAMSDIVDISIIATPPASRLSVRTLVRPHSSAVIREAFSRELSRGGQVFYLHNRIESMDDCIEVLQGIAPQARIRKLHGKMSVDEMTRIMFAFRNNEFDVLVSTTVIEVGIDVPNANTLLVEDADHFGLAQLHQLRGRVGRGGTQAYAYLLCNDRDNKRLKAMERASNLGEGVLVARHDLEIRGIGEILGDEQSGHIHNIGFTLYMRLLELSIKALDRGETELDKAVILSHVNMPIHGRIPSDFMPSNGERLTWYQRLMTSESLIELNLNAKELEDLYGYVPAEIYELKQSISEHIAARHWGIESLREEEGSVVLQMQHTKELEALSFLLGHAFKQNFQATEKERVFVIKKAQISQVADAILAGTVF
jgi:transcription-repair coupling factor (superfamily II helicase)